MNNVDQLLSPSEEFNLDELIGEAPPSSPLPTTAVRSQAASIAFLSEENGEGLDVYQNIVNENEFGTNDLIKSRMEQLKQDYSQVLKDSLMGILADPNLDMEQKQEAVNTIRDGKTDDVSTTEVLAAQALSSPSEGETEYDESVRVSTADMIKEIDRTNAEIQSLVNGVKAARDPNKAKQIAELAEFVLTPMEQGLSLAQVQTARYAEGEVSAMEVFQALTLPGSAIENIREKLMSLQGDDRVLFSKNLIDIIKSNSDLLFTDDNQVTIIENLEKVFSDEYSNAERYADNVFNLLDMIGIGALLRGAVKGRKALTAPMATNVAEDVSRASTGSSRRGVEEEPLSPPMVDKNAQRYEQVRKEYEEAISVAANELDAGSVSRLRQEKQALEAAIAEKYSVRTATEANAFRVRKEQLRAQLARVNEQLSMNTKAAQARGRLNALEKEMQRLQKNVQLVPAQLNPIMDSLRRAQMQGITMDIMPRSPGHILYSTNPERARNIHHLLYTSNSDEVALSLFGVSRIEALMQGMIPQVTTEAGKVRAFPTDLERSTRNAVIDGVEDIIAGPGGVQFTNKEIESAKAQIVNDFSEVNGLKLNSGMTAVKFDGTDYSVDAIYTKGEGGWLLPEHARDQALVALRERGITEDQITIMKREGTDYVPVKYGEYKGIQGDYAVRISDKRAIEATDITDWDKLSVKRNFFDRFQFAGGERWGSLNRHLFPPDTVLDTAIVGAAVVSEQKSAILVDALATQAKRFSDVYKSLPKDRKAAMFEYIKEANLNGLKFDRNQLYADGFSQAEIGALKDWRSFWDAHYYLENLDVVRSLRRDGFQWFSSPNLEVVVKPSGKNLTKGQGIYDPAQDRIINMSRQEMDDLYNNGGYIGDLRSPETINGETVENIIVRNIPNEYARQFRNDDKVLNYREGYYQVSYKSPRFIDEYYRDASGVERRRTVGVAGSVKDAREATQLFRNQNPNNRYEFRRDERQISRDSDSYWQMNSVGGRIAQRHRGKTLQGSVGIQEFGKGDFIEMPGDSAVKAIMSISGRTAFRPTLEAARERFLRQYADVLPKDPVTRQVRFPQSRSEITRLGDSTGKQLADARTTYEYIHYLENGYINSIDNAVKNAFHLVSDILGSRGWTRLERAAEAGSRTNLTGSVKGVVFGAMLATNPLRQWIVQSNQAIRTFAYNPAGWVDGSLAKLSVDFMTNMATGRPVSKNSEDFIKWVSNTGIFQNISRNNLVRDTFLDFSDKSSRIGEAMKSPVRALRAVGFDIGEQANQLAHAAAVWDSYRRSGKNVLDRRVQGQMQAAVGDLSLNMNFAVDMPYNQNALNIAMTYMQVVHKAIVQPFNRNLTRSERIRLATADMAIWGVPTGMITYMLGNDWLPDNPVGREILTHGMQAYFLNSFFSYVLQDDVNVDWSSLDPRGVDGFKEMFQQLLTDGGLKAVIDRSPTAQVFGISEGRIPTAMKMAARMFTDSWNEDVIDPVTFGQVLDSFGRISSGWNNYQKARAMYATGMAKDKMGRLTDTDVSKFESVAQAFGFGTGDTRDFYETLITASEAITDWEDQGKKDAEWILKDIAMRYNNELPADEVLVHVMNLVMADPTGNMDRDKYLLGLTNRLFSDPQDQTMEMLSKIMGIQDPAGYRDLIRRSPLPEEDKQKYIEFYDSVTSGQERIRGE